MLWVELYTEIFARWASYSQGWNEYIRYNERWTNEFVITSGGGGSHDEQIRALQVSLPYF